MENANLASVLGRKPGETYDAYRKRRLFFNKAVKDYLRGRVFWASGVKGSPGAMGTYRRESPPATGQ